MSPDHSPRSGESRLDQMMIEAAVGYWQLPITIFTSWWNVAVAPYLPGPPHHGHSDTHEQLVVPEPLEDSGERALFA